MEDDYTDELKHDIERLLAKINQSAHDLYLIGSEMQRIEFFEILRRLMLEKEMDNDQIAVEVLSWAYERLSEEG